MEEIKPNKLRSKHGFGEMEVGQSIDVNEPINKIRPILSYIHKMHPPMKFKAVKTESGCRVTRNA